MKLKVKYLEHYNKDWGALSSKNGDSGYDLRAAVNETIVLHPQERKVVANGLVVELTDTGSVENNVELQIRPRSGNAAKKGITVVNTPGTIDFDYRGELMTILLNTGTEDFVIEPGDRIAQLVVCPIYKPTVEEVEVMSETDRGDGGFGHSGVK